MIRVVLMVVQVESKAHANVVVYPYIGFLEFLAQVIAEIRLETQKAVGLDFRAAIEGIILMLHIVTPAGTQLEIVSQQLVVGMNIILITVFIAIQTGIADGKLWNCLLYTSRCV